MGELKLLGAQRIKALTNMLNEQEQAELNSVKIVRPTHLSSVIYADDKTGMGDLRMVYDEALKKAQYYAKQMQEATGVRYEIRAQNYGVSHTATTDWGLQYNDHQRGNIDEHYQIKKKYTEKRNALWLCETLEEAKAIVGIE